MTKETLIDLLRGRILRGLRTGTLAPGDRLPSARTVGTELKARHQVVLAAYHTLAAEGVVELRERAGIFVARARSAEVAAPGAHWLIDTLLEGWTRDVPVAELHNWIRRATHTLRLRTTVIAGTRDRIAAMCRELQDDYGLDVTGLDASEIESPTDATLEALRGVDLIVGPSRFGHEIRQLGQRVKVPVIIADLRLDLLGDDWRERLQEPLYMLVADERSVTLITQMFSTVPGAEQNLRMRVVGRDDLATIPEDAAVYISLGAEMALGGATVPGRHVPRVRAFSSEAARQLTEHIVRANLKALSETSARRDRSTAPR